MSERTRLDEIVEEELRKRDSWLGDTKVEPDPVALRIAERAFRHGVEQATHGVFRPGGISISINDVQPGPADAEKKHPCACSQPNDPGVVHRKTFPCFVDRRKGQRRKHLAELSALMEHTVGERAIFRARYVNGWYPDRRSGNDRRKPHGPA